MKFHLVLLCVLENGNTINLRRRKLLLMTNVRNINKYAGDQAVTLINIVNIIQLMYKLVFTIKHVKNM